LWAYKILTPDTPSDSFWWLLMFRGFGLSMLFIPITTLALSTLHGQQIGQGAAFTGMMRQLGGSFGVAVITTFIAQTQMKHRVDIISHLGRSRPMVQDRVMMMQRGFENRGMTPDVALKSAYKALDFSVTKQAMVLSYMDVFLYIGILFLICVPFILLIREKKNKKVDLSAAMH
jgi:DHA2 family multidrug resistance protein